MNQYACSEALDCMQAYYKVACKRFIDDIAVEAVETSLLAKLGDILSPLRVTYLAADEVTSVAGESDESRAKRKQLTNQLDVLVHGLETCKKFVVGTRDTTIVQGIPGESSPDLSLLSLKTGSSEDITDDEPAEVEAIDDDQVCPTEAVAEPQSGTELDEAPFEVAHAVEDVPVFPDDARGITTTVESGGKKKKKSRKNLNP
ncbi:hypothetical protein E8E12_000061 [Didymella heteroderae]|uniref:GED domain-containing protein n=1 Tax=Didymella heteroderae TaxID=1769908 RepID=A0A9P5BU92_9PLEO|nr:hypothetical protein E8E12_000061 [Didymella heteroderae]